MPLSLGTVTDGLKKILPLFEPLYQAILEKNRSEFYFNADETRWKVFEEIEGKTSHKWWLWVFLGRETAIYVIDPTRSAKVPEAHFPEGTKAVIAADRYGADKSLSAKRASIRIAYCWVHVRRDFIKGANGYPAREAWYRDWVS